MVFLWVAFVLPCIIYFVLCPDSFAIPLVGLYIHMVSFKQCIFLSMTVGPTLDALLRFAPPLTRTDKPVSGPIRDTMTISNF